jgi:transcriptional regulator with XRE-family HTH domain
MISFGDNLKHVRASKNISQGELAKMLEMHATHISRYERNITTPSIDVLKKIAEQLDVPTDILVYGSRDEKVKYNIKDNELISMFTKVQTLEKQDIDCIKVFLKAFLLKKEMQEKVKD